MVGIDYARSGVFALALEQARIEVDLRFTSSESGDQMLQGDIAVDLEPIGVYAAERIQIAATGTLAMSAIDHMLISAEKRNLSTEQASGVLERLIVSAGVDAARVSECRSTVAPTDQGHPRAEVVF